MNNRFSSVCVLTFCFAFHQTISSRVRPLMGAGCSTNGPSAIAANSNSLPSKPAAQTVQTAATGSPAAPTTNTNTTANTTGGTKCIHIEFTWKEALTTYHGKDGGFGMNADAGGWYTNQQMMHTKVCNQCGVTAHVQTSYCGDGPVWPEDINES